MTGAQVLRGALAAPFRIWRTSLVLLAVNLGATLRVVLRHPETAAMVIFVLLAVSGSASVEAIGYAMIATVAAAWLLARD